MGILDGVKSVFGNTNTKGGHYAYVRCNRCGEALQTRINLYTEPSRKEEGGFVVRKVLIGSQRCFERIEIVLHFNKNYKVTDSSIEGGEFITVEEYEADKAQQA